MTNISELAIEKDKAQTSLKYRFAWKLMGNVLAIIFTFLQQVIAPRLLGPVGYGNFTYLKSVFDGLFSFFDSGSSSAFYAKISQEPERVELKTFYLKFAGIVILGGFVLMGFMAVGGVGEKLFIGIRADWLILAYLLSGIIWLSQIIGKVVDAEGLTVVGEGWRVLQRALGAAVILLMFLMGISSVSSFFVAQVIMGIILIWGWWQILRRKRVRVYDRSVKISGVWKEFWKYSSPLILLSFTAFISLGFERWLLQEVSGSAEQGYYGLAYQVGAFCFLFTSAMTPLFLRDFSKKLKAGGLEEARSLLIRTLKLFYVISAYFGAYVYVNADFVTKIVGGEIFNSAAPIIGLMALYPLHQTYGQICGSVFFADGKTKKYRNIGVAFQVLGMIAACVVLAPKSYGGLELGAYGLGLKMVFVQIIYVNVLLLMMAKDYKLRFWKHMAHQMVVFGMFYVMSKVVSTYVMTVDGLSDFLVNGMIYTLIVGLFVLFQPGIMGGSRKVVMDVVFLGMKR